MYGMLSRSTHLKAELADDDIVILIKQEGTGVVQV